MKKSNNKGFSLVELIIVIAIMVVLVAVIAPQYLKYVNNAKVSTDVQTASDLATAIDVAVADGSAPFGKNTTITAGPSGTLKIGTLDLSTVKSKYDSTANFTITGDDTSGVTKITLKVGTTDYIVYPDPENTTNGIADTTKGLKK